MYTCYNCNYSNNNKTKINNHLSRRIKCKSIRDIEINLNECKEYILNKVNYEDYLKIIEDNNNTNNIILELNQQLKNENNEFKYENNILKYKIQELNQESINNKIKWVNEKEKLLSKILKFNKIINNINTINNNNNNITINIVNFTDTYDIKKLSDEEFRACVNNKNKQYSLNALELVHFDIIFPEFMNVYISNMNNNKMQVYDNNQWTYRYFNNEIERMIDQMELLILYKIDEWEKNDIPCAREKHNYNVYQKRKLNINIRPHMINNIRKMLYDNRHMIKK